VLDKNKSRSNHMEKIQNIHLWNEYEKKYGKLLYEEILSFNYQVEFDGYTELKIRFKMLNEEGTERFVIDVTYEGAENIHFKNVGTRIGMGEILNYDELVGWENLNYHVYDYDDDGDPCDHIEFYCKDIVINAIYHCDKTLSANPINNNQK
jgi:hypothetical protein